ncbi:MAG: type II toxin-antitoxin system RelE/ParE family toxin [Casimicrobiaceae bacterium]|nr:type II toxin-antitoxin system RelE/ParE family toxin [Pseudomonadota bacterium]
MIPYTFHPEAEVELAEAALFYESRVERLGRSFAAEVQRTIALIREYPDAGAPLDLPVRRVLVGRFPYAVVYRHAAESVLIVAVAHLHRRPGYWRRRK